MWLYYALFTALGSSVINPIAKRTSKHFHISFYFFFYNLVSVIFLFLFVELKGEIPNVGSDFFGNVLMSALLDVVAFLMATHAIKHYPLSLLAPISAFNPVFAMFISIFTLHELPTLLKFVGTVVIVAGAYVINISEFREGLLAPFKKLFSNKGVQLYLLVQFIFGITPTFQKRAIFETHPSDPILVSLASNLLVTIIMGVIGLRYWKSEKPALTQNAKWFIFVGAINALAQAAAYYAFSLANVSYSIAVGQLSILLTILWAGIFFKEENIRERLFGASIMVLGTVLMLVWSTEPTLSCRETTL